MNTARPIYLRISPFRIFLVAAILLTLGIVVFDGAQKSPGYQFQNDLGGSDGRANYSSSFVCSPCSTPSVHSASIASAADGGINVVWFGGLREGSRDVRIFSSSKISGSSAWSSARTILDRSNASMEVSRYIKKLGNPVLGRDKENRLWLFYVTVSAGGWSGSAINYQVSTNDGKNWSKPMRLVTSPFFNVSTLVRGGPLAHNDGSLSLPVYHELLGKFTELIRISPDGRILDKKRISYGRKFFQPAITKLSETEAVMIMRHTGSSPRRVAIAHTGDSGASWTQPVTTSLPNPDAGIAITTGTDKSLVVVYNDSETDRSNLALAISHDRGHTWKRIHYFEKKETTGSSEEYSYPSIVRQENQYHLVYTWKRKGIRYVNFNEAWIRKRERSQ